MSWAQMRFDHKPTEDDLLLDAPAPAEETDDAWDDPIVEPSLLADFQPDTARDAAAVGTPPSDGDEPLLFSAIGAPPDGDDL